MYLLDANVYLEAYKRYYAFDLCPGFWQSLEFLASSGAIASIDRTWNQRQEGQPFDQWKAAAPPSLFLPSDEADVVAAYRTAVQWVQQQPRFPPGAKAHFAADADAWLIAYARAKSAVVVTHEAPAPGPRSSVKIPDVCQALGVRFTDTFSMLRDLQISYHWTAPRTT